MRNQLCKTTISSEGSIFFGDELFILYCTFKIKINIILKHKDMKTKQYLFLSLLTGFALLSACKKDELQHITGSDKKNAANTQSDSGPLGKAYKDWHEDFATANSLDLRWNLYGNPLPVWIPYAAHRSGLFENNGRLPYGSRAVSKTIIGNGKGYTIEAEVFIDVINSEVKGISPEIGVTRELVQNAVDRVIQPGISMKLAYVGMGLSTTDPDTRNKTYVQADALLQNGTVATSRNYELRGSTLGDGWHRMKIVVNASRKVSFYLDGQFIWSPPDPIDASLLRDKNVILGFVSGGSLGHAYHDWVEVSYPPDPDLPPAISDNIPLK
jgi:hypothetical protein